MSENPSAGPEKFCEFLFGEKPGADGRVPVGDDAERAMRGVEANVRALALKHGLPVEAVGLHPIGDVRSTTTAAAIRAVAEPLMETRSAEARTAISRLHVEMPDGTKVRATKVDLAFLDRLGKAIENLAMAPSGWAKWAGDALKRGLSIAVKVGSWRGEVRVNNISPVETKDAATTGETR